MYRLFGNEATSTILPFIEVILLIVTIIGLANNECRTFWQHTPFNDLGRCRDDLEEVSSNCTLLSTEYSYDRLCKDACETGNVCLLTNGVSFDVFVSHYIFRLLAETAAIASAMFKKKYTLVETTPLSFEWQPIDLREQRFLCSVQTIAFIGVLVGESVRIPNDWGLVNRAPGIVLIVVTIGGLLFSAFGVYNAQHVLMKGSSVTESGGTLMNHLMIAKTGALVWESWSAVVDIMTAVLVAENGKQSISSYLLLFVEVLRTAWEFQSELRKQKVSYFEGIVIIPIGSGRLLKKLNNERKDAVAGNLLFQTVILTTDRLTTSAQAVEQMENAVEATVSGPIGGAAWRTAITSEGSVRPSSFKAWLCIQAITDSEHIWVDENKDLNFAAVGDAPGMIILHEDTSITVEFRHRIEGASARVSAPIIIKNVDLSPVNITDGVQQEWDRSSESTRPPTEHHSSNNSEADTTTSASWWESRRSIRMEDQASPEEDPTDVPTEVDVADEDTEEEMEA